MILEVIEPFVEAVNLILAIIIVAIGLWIAKILTLDLKKAWNYFVGAIALFGLHEVVGTLEELGLINIEGLYALTEFLFIVMFLISIFAFRKLFIQISKNKNFRSKQL
jgi:hypothetical protein